jgi:hypothetical protein
VSTENEQRTEEREVRSDNPDLSPEANRLLTEELREAVGAESVRVPTGSPQPRADSERTRSPVVATLTANRPLIVVTLLAALVVGAAVSLATGSWWAVVAVVGAHAVGTLVVATAAIQLTTQTEHASPDVAARLEEEGVADPDRVLSDLVEAYAPATAAAEQRTALTPSSRPGPAAGSGTAIAVLPWWVIVGLMAISLVAPIAGDSPRLWSVPAIVWPLCLAWIALQRRMQAHDRAEERNDPGDAEPPAHGSRTRLLPIYAAIVAATVLFTILMGVLVGAL